MAWIPPNMSEYCVSNTVATGCQPSTLMFLTLISKLFGNSKDVNPNIKPEPKEYDFIIVGGGTAGSVIASRLSENTKWNVSYAICVISYWNFNKFAPLEVDTKK